jgi:hypothetical protein
MSSTTPSSTLEAIHATHLRVLPCRGASPYGPVSLQCFETGSLTLRRQKGAHQASGIHPFPLVSLAWSLNQRSAKVGKVLPKVVVIASGASVMASLQEKSGK